MTEKRYHPKEEKVIRMLESLDISYRRHEHPPIPTAEVAIQYWKDIDSTHCKNLFFRNHKGNRHYLVIIEFTRNLAIRDLEQRLKQGKLTFASDRRLMKYLGVEPGSVSAFGLINDTGNHVHVFLDHHLLQSEKISFHPNINTVSTVISMDDFLRYMEWTGNGHEFIKLYE